MQSYRNVNRVNLKVSYFRKIRPFLTKEAAMILYRCTMFPIYADFVHDFGIC